MNARGIALVALITFSFLTGCVTTPTPPAPSELTAPTPIIGNTGEYLSPFTSDDTVAPWVQKGMTARFGAQAGKAIGAYAGQKAMEQVPFVGGYLGAAAGEKIGREASIAASGGREAMKEQSDLSFETADELALYMYVKGSAHEDYADVLKLTQEIYPELNKRYWPAIYAAAQPSTD